MKILIVKTSSLGDVIQAIPIARWIKNRIPSAEVHWVVEKRFQDPLQRHPLVSKVLPIDTKGWKKSPLTSRRDLSRFISLLREEKYDYVFDIQGNIKSGVVALFSRSKKKIGFHQSQTREWMNTLAMTDRIKIDRSLPIVDQYLQMVQLFFKMEPSFESKKELLPITETEQEELDEMIEKAEGRPIIMVCPASAWENKRLSTTALVGLVKKIRDKFDPYLFFIFGSEKEKEEAEMLHRQFPEDSRVIGGLPISVWQNLMSKTSAVISVDSSALHLAGLADVPTFSVFGPTLAEVFKPAGEKHISFQGSCPYGEKFLKQCPYLRDCKTGLCMKGINGEELFERFEGWYSSLHDSADCLKI